MTSTSPVLEALRAAAAPGSMTPMTETEEGTASLIASRARALAVLQAMTRYSAPCSSTRKRALSAAYWAMERRDFDPYGRRAVSPMKENRAWGRRTISARRTVRPPNPEKKNTDGGGNEWGCLH